ncbi:sulfurtransferase [Bacillus sp. CGMCC 1.16607]|uniref:sulfurtransferase n=1 Tax=Bacillus sp. CGMCC 1.16607 TaxID=3351842 RepID=UPI003635748F
MRNIVDKEWVKSRLGSNNFMLLDCRFSLGNPESGEIAYKASHIPGAVYCHLEKHLSGPVLEHGGRHPLPNIETFHKFIEDAGIGNDSIIVAYDNGESAYAGRLWWLMKYIGHEEVYVLNGGYNEWVAAGLPVDEKEVTPSHTKYNIQLQPHLMVSFEEVKSIVEKKYENTKLIDSREPKRFAGLEEPIDKVAGRIPGAINKFWNEGLENGRFKSLEEQKDRFMDLNQQDSIIVYCGSGVTATPNFLILHELGFTNLKLYPGSYSDWISHHDVKIEKN